MIEGVRHASSNSVAQILELLLDEYCVQQLNKFEGETLVSVIEEGLIQKTRRKRNRKRASLVAQW